MQSVLCFERIHSLWFSLAPFMHIHELHSSSRTIDNLFIDHLISICFILFFFFLTDFYFFIFLELSHKQMSERKEMDSSLLTELLLFYYLKKKCLVLRSNFSYISFSLSCYHRKSNQSLILVQYRIENSPLLWKPGFKIIKSFLKRKFCPSW